MIYIKFNADRQIVAVQYDENFEDRSNVEHRWNWRRTDLKQVEELAAMVTVFTGELHIGVDMGENFSPRYDIMKMFKVGDVVSHGFNGDYYPSGTITSISKSLKLITTSTNEKFYRARKSDRWRMNHTWTLVQGYHDKRNPSF